MSKPKPAIVKQSSAARLGFDELQRKFMTIERNYETMKDLAARGERLFRHEESSTPYVNITDACKAE